MKRRKAKELIAESFKELASHRNIEKITVREITDNCGYSPATFYRQFHDKYDLIAWDYAKELKENLERVGIEGFTWQQALEHTVQYYEEHRKYLCNLFRHTGGIYSFEQYMTEVNVKSLLVIIRRKNARISKLEERCLWGYCCGGVKNAVDWLQGKFEATPEEMVNIFGESVPELLKKYL